MLSIAICDDEIQHAEQLARSVRRQLGEQTAGLRLFDLPEELLGEVTDGYAPDAAILNIRMDEMDGITLAGRLNSALPQCGVIFATSYLSYAPDVYETEHVYFVLKSEFEHRIGQVLKKAISGETPILRYPVGSAYRSTRAEDVLYIERVLRKTRLQLLSGGEEWTPLHPTQLIEPLHSFRFIRCHQSFWVNFRHIRSMERASFLLTEDISVPISRTYRDSAREQFFAHFRTY